MFYTNIELEKYIDDNKDILTEEDMYEITSMQIAFCITDISLINHFIRKMINLGRDIMSIRCIACMTLNLSGYTLAEIDYVFSALFEIDGSLACDSELFKALANEYSKTIVNAIWKRQYFKTVLNSYWFPVLLCDQSYLELNELEEDAMIMVTSIMPLMDIMHILSTYLPDLNDDLLKYLIISLEKNKSHYSSLYNRLVNIKYPYIFENERVKKIIKRINMEKKLSKKS